MFGYSQHHIVFILSRLSPWGQRASVKQTSKEADKKTETTINISQKDINPKAGVIGKHIYMLSVNTGPLRCQVILNTCTPHTVKMVLQHLHYFYYTASSPPNTRTQTHNFH